MDIARILRRNGIAVIIGGFHVSGCVSMLPELPPELKEAAALGISLFAGEAEGRLDEILQAAYGRRLKPLYNFIQDLPALEGQPPPYLPGELIRHNLGNISSFDGGRGCPFSCSFCTIINVQGRKSRYRSADDIERLMRANHGSGVTTYFITDDNFARNRNWEAIFDRLIELREKHHLQDPSDDPGRHAVPQDFALCGKGRESRMQTGIHRAGEHQSRQPQGSVQGAESHH